MKITKELIQEAQIKIIENKSLLTERKLELVKELESLQEINPVTGAVLTYSALVAILATVHNRYFAYYAKKCYGLKSKDRKICKIDAKIKAHENEIIEAKKIISSQCKKTKDPKKCELRMKKAIGMFEREIERLEYLKSKGKKDIASALTVKGKHPANKYPITSRSYDS